jgi:hypothetical protein
MTTSKSKTEYWCLLLLLLAVLAVIFLFCQQIDETGTKVERAAVG